MIHGLGWVEFGNGGKDAKGIAGEEDEIRGVAGEAGELGVLDEFDGIGPAGILGDGGVVVVDDVVFVVDDIFKNGSVVEGMENIGFGFLAKIDGFGVAPAFDIEDAFVGPDMFVVTYKLAVRIGGESGFSGAGEPEEDGAAI